MLQLGGFTRARGRRGLEGSDYRRVLRGNEVVECSVLRVLELMTGEMLRWKAVRNTVARSDDEKQAITARLQSTLKYDKGQGNGDDNRDPAESREQ